MTVYVDDMQRRARVGRITANWSHLMADTHEELVEMANLLRLRPEWIQHPGTHREHFDVTETKRVEAIRLGAVEITYPRQTGALMTQRRRRRDRARRTRGDGMSEESTTRVEYAIRWAEGVPGLLDVSTPNESRPLVETALAGSAFNGSIVRRTVTVGPWEDA